VFRYDKVIESKPMLLSIIIFVVIGILSVPIILPHLFHGTHFFHIVLHTVGTIVAVFLTIITAIAYAKIKTKRLLFTMIAFSVFIGAEALALVDATWPFTFYIGEISIAEVSHMFIISMLGIFTLAVFRKD
jgi:hypothetical protein